MILVDPSAWIDYFRGNDTPQADRLDTLLGREELLIGDIVLAGILPGFDNERDFRTALSLPDSLKLVEIGDRDFDPFVTCLGLRSAMA